MSEARKTVGVWTRLTKEEAEALREQAEAEERSIARVVARAIRQYLGRVKP